MRLTLALALVVLISLVACPMVIAVDEAGQDFLLSAGLYRPTDGDIRDATSSNWLSVALGYKVSSTPVADHIVEIGYTGASGDARETDEDVWMKAKVLIVPLTYTYMTRPREGSKFYYGAGAGIYFCRTTVDIDDDGDLSSVKTSDTKFGLHLVGGVMLSDSISVELRWNKMLGDAKVFESQGETEKKDLSGISLMITGRV